VNGPEIKAGLDTGPFYQALQPRPRQRSALAIEDEATTASIALELSQRTNLQPSK
jgi:putative heme iron utilization protein